MKFNVGDKVKLNKDEPKYGRGAVGPDEIGSVVGPFMGFGADPEQTTLVRFENDGLIVDNEDLEFVEAGVTAHGEFKVGDKVRMIVPSDETPKHGWGNVVSGDVGIVEGFIPKLGIVSVSFAEQEFWNGLESELELELEEK